MSYPESKEKTLQSQPNWLKIVYKESTLESALESRGLELNYVLTVTFRPLDMATEFIHAWS